jgi:site-specific recombinase XerD
MYGGITVPGMGAEELARWRAHGRARNLATRTLNQRENLLRDLLTWAASHEVDWRHLEGDHVLLFLATRKIAPPSRAGYISHIGQFYKWAVKHAQGVDADPTEDLIRPRQQRRLPRPTRESDFALALAGATPLMHAWLLLAGMAGLRCIEISRIQWDDVDAVKCEVRVLGKGNRERIVALHPAVIDALDKLERDSVWVAGKPLSPGAVGRRINTYLHRCGIAATAHQLRHRAATEAYRVDGDLLVVQRMLGHANPGTTAIYADVTADSIKSTMRAMRLPDE